MTAAQIRGAEGLCLCIERRKRGHGCGLADQNRRKLVRRNLRALAQPREEERGDGGEHQNGNDIDEAVHLPPSSAARRFFARA